MPDHVPGVDMSAEQIEGEFAERLDSLEGREFTFVSLGTPNSKEMFEAIKEEFTEEFGAESVEYYEKSHFSRPLSDEDVQNITSMGPDGVIEGFALCGSCNSSSSVDAIAFENKNIPTVQLISENFIDLNRKIASSYGYTELPFVAIPQDSKYKSKEEITDLIHRIKWSVQSMLTCEDCLDGACSVEAETTTALE